MWSKEKKRQYNKKYNKVYRQKNKEYFRKYFKEHYQEIKEYWKRYYQKNKEKLKLREKLRGPEYRKKNKKKISKRMREYYQKNREEILKRHRNRLKIPINKEKKKECNRIYEKKRRKINKRYCLNRNISLAIYKALKSKKAGRKWETLVGYTIEDLIKYLEKLFDDKMNWDNYGSYWEIDHRIPKSWFKYETAENEEFKKCWALENLQPLEKWLNRSKNNRFKS